MSTNIEALREQERAAQAELTKASKRWSRAENKCIDCGSTEPLAVRIQYDFGKPYSVIVCPKCSPEASHIAESLAGVQEGIDRWRKAYGLRQARASNREKLNQIPLLYRQSTFGNYVPQNASQGAMAHQVRQWCDDSSFRQSHPNLLVYGPPGVGKTHLQVAAARRMILKGQDVWLFNEARLNSKWRQAYKAFDTNSDYEGCTPDDIVSILSSAGALLLDDVGKTKLTDAWGTFLYQIIDNRLAAMLPTFFTSNFSPLELASRIGHPTMDRVLAGLQIEVTGNSMRGLKAA